MKGLGSRLLAWLRGGRGPDPVPAWAPCPTPGMEFDWLAADEAGSLAIFSTGGDGPVPPAVGVHELAHTALAEGLPRPRFGTGGVWLDFAEQGLVVLDWDRSVKAYVVEARPSAPIAPALAASVRALPDLPTYPGRFAEVQRVRPWSAGA